MEMVFVGKLRMMASFMAILALWATVAIAGVNENLLEAAKLGNLPKVKRLLDAGAEVNFKNKDGITALMVASARGHTEIVQALLAKGAEVNTQDKDGVTALMYANTVDHREVKELLIKAGAK